MYCSILVPLDGSAFSEQALPLAAAIARCSGALLRLVHVHYNYTPDPISVAGLPVIDERLRSLGRAHERVYLEQLKERLCAQSDQRIAVELLDPAGANSLDTVVAQALAAHSTTTGGDLVVLATHARGGAARFWRGSVANALIHVSAAPVLALRATEDGQAPATDLPRRILLPLDGSLGAERILEPALALGRVIQAEYTLLHVATPAHPAEALSPPSAPTTGQREPQLPQVSPQRYLERVAWRLRALGATVRTSICAATCPVATILETAHQHGLSLIALATHGRYGSAWSTQRCVTDQVLRGAARPVLVVGPRDNAGRRGRLLREHGEAGGHLWPLHLAPEAGA